MSIISFSWAAITVWGFALIVNLRLFINPLFRAALIFEVSALLGLSYLLYENGNLGFVELKVLFVIALGVSLSRLFFVYDKIFRAEQFVLQNRSIASLLFLLKTKIKPDKSVEEINSNDMVIFKMYKKHAENENLGSHHMAFEENDFMINLKD
jgi:hypothetical protein